MFRLKLVVAAVSLALVPGCGGSPTAPEVIDSASEFVRFTVDGQQVDFRSPAIKAVAFRNEEGSFLQIYAQQNCLGLGFLLLQLKKSALARFTARQYSNSTGELFSHIVLTRQGVVDRDVGSGTLAISRITDSFVEGTFTLAGSSSQQPGVTTVVVSDGSFRVSFAEKNLC